MKRLDVLTPEQEALLPAIRDNWLAVGLSTQPAEREKAVAACRVAYAKANLKEPNIIIWLDSPLAGAMGAHILASTKTPVVAQVWAQVGAQVWAQVGDQVWDQVGAQVGDQVWDQVWDQVGAQVVAQVWDQVGAQVVAQVGAEVGAQVYRCGYGLHDANWIGFCDALARFGIDTASLDGIKGLTEACGWWWPFEGAVILTERPARLHRNAAHQLHCTDGMAIAYPDGWGLYCLNGVRVPAQLVLTPAEQLDCQSLLKERNAEIRREFVRKAGIEKVCRDLHATCLDRQDSYELLLLNLGDQRERPYLKMTNPSIGVFHIEGVAPECRTVRQALNWRNGLTEEMIDEVNGGDWAQQGDVILRPSDVKTFKSKPIILT